ncbi:LacI family DNA-binding transcriptional regulator [Fertoebacter nigrum]|uniref:LacI family DNA-binding transcriptional regulator n=1 Tax=Fertoeibacter niger TaxID=2656921 RepID=A0A8X8KNQ6_9RHOB|nr:LacI family DNA-binding transcriptional regulator [Fertoeibacter niger]NUB45260.1 LacI family DNA-binding transcriptional regulator [Fertoeibacter niger]
MTRQASHKTMDDFARACGVSRPTLSKYFDDPGSVKASTRERIELALAASDYQPNLFARNLNRKRTRHIGIIVPSMSDPFYAEVVGRIELRLRDDGYWPILIATHSRADLEAEAVRTLLALKVAGAVVAPLGHDSERGTFDRLTEAIPVVCFDSHIGPGMPFVGNNNGQSMSVIVEYLCRSGEPPLFFDIPHVNNNSPERLNSYISAMQVQGHAPEVIACPARYCWDFERAGYEQMQAMLARGSLPGQTVLCANDRMAFGAMAAAFAAGRKVGRRRDSDLRIAGHDDHPLSRYTCPPLTTMAQDVSAMAGRSVEMLLARMDDADEGRESAAESVILDATLVMRDSA